MVNLKITVFKYFRVLSIFSSNNVAMSVCLSVGWSAKVSYSGTEPSQTY